MPKVDKIEIDNSIDFLSFLCKILKMNEKALIKQIQNGDKQAMEEIFNNYYDRIIKFCFRRTSSKEIAEDITSAVFLDAVKNIERFQWRGDNSFKAWIYQIANNKICDYFRKKYRHKTIDIEKVGELKADSSSNPQSGLILEQSKQELNEAISRLSPKDQQIINMVFFEEMDSQEIAEVLDCSVNAVYVGLHRALKRLKSKFN